MPERDKPAVLAVSPNGRSIYDADGTVYTSGGGRSPQSALVEPNDGYEGLKFARFLDDDTLGVGFTTGYYFDGYGSAGSTQYVVQVFRRTQAAWWDLVACQCLDRTIGDGFAVRDIAWHPFGALAWLDRSGLLWVGIGKAPPGPLEPEHGDAWPPEYPAPDAMKLEVEVVGEWNAIRFDASGERLFATGREGKAELDLVNAALRCGDGPWQTLLVS